MQLPSSRRIVLLTPSLDYGGAEVVIVQLAKFLVSRNWTVSIVSMLPPRAFVETVEAFGATVVSLEMKRTGLNARGILALIRYLRSFQPHLIHAHMFHANVLARLLKPVLNIPVICTVQSTMEAAMTRDRAPLRDLAYRFTDWGCVRTTTVAEAATKRYVQEKLVPPGRVETIPNGVDVQHFRPDQSLRDRIRRELDWNGRFVWMAAGRLERAKDYPNLLDAFGHVHAAHPHARLAIAGDGTLREELERRAQAKGIATAVQFLGLRGDIVELLNAADAFVLSSAWEGTPIVLLEAGACGKPIVSTLVGDASRIVLSNQTGYLAPPRNAGALAGAMAKLLTRPQAEREAMGKSARAHIMNRFSLDATHERYLELFHRVLTCA